ncbi:molybdopterin-dependent oxidoreductase [Arenimonas terrae]|uniref:Molybdopterin oxidoreductase family protein n=1 Tax=Arenimonas terrae TaxID=2546226 RepID=A0A5C4RUA5_9GAMM|nr:molybdopterin-dependent oxidoreductase [Arenimonas terrae]TNJ34740.1 molybdopterin oxidoreductase family protein [Arenimonas terrae]
MARESRFRACPLCEAICGLELQYEGPDLVAIRGDAADPFSRGHICPKGNALLDLEADPDRLRAPLRRRGSEWEPIGWDEALAEAGERLAAVQREHGNDAVAAYLGNPNVHHFGHIAYLPPLLKSLRSKNIYSASSVDQWPHQLVDWLMYGHQFLLPIPDIDRTAYMLVLGANPVASNGSLMTAPGAEKRLKALAARGRLVVVDPRRTETAEIASEHHFIRPGSDAWFLLALLQEVLALGPPSVQAYAGKLHGLDEALAAIVAMDTGDVAGRTGIARAEIARLAREFRAAPQAVAYGRMGVSVQAFGSLCQWLIQLLNLVTGNLDREGGALPNEPAFPVTGPGTSPGNRGRWHSRVRGLPEFAGELPVATLAEEIRTPGPGQVRALLTCAGNPVLSTPDGRALDAALASLDFMVSVDVYLNETTRHAHLILPPASPLTQPHYDLHFNAFAVRRVAKLSPPMRERSAAERADWEILDRLGAAHAAAAGKPWRDLPPPRDLIAAGLARGGSGLDLAQLDAAPHGIDLGPLRPSLLSRLETASGAIECAPPLLMAELARLAAVAVDAPGTLRLVGRRHVRSNNSWMHNAPRLVKGKPRHQLLMHPADLAARGLADGDRVRVSSAVGSVVTDVVASEDLMPGVACLPHGFGHARPGTRQARAAEVAGASYNDLTDSTALDGPSGNAALNGLAIEVAAA